MTATLGQKKLDGPLAGIRVIDMSLMLLGPSATQLLANLGADVIKIEPHKGDGRRTLGPSIHKSMTSQYLLVNRGKRSIALDVKRPEGRDVVLTLCKNADLFVHNSRRQAMERLKLAYEDISKVNKEIVYCAAVGFGKGGAYADMPALDDMIQGLTAMPVLQEKLTGKVSYTPFNLADRICGMAFAQIILAALLCRARTGVGQYVELPMFETMAEFVISEHLWGHTFVPPNGELGATRQFERRPLATKNSYICLWIGNVEQCHRLFDAIGQPELKNNSRFKTRVEIVNNLETFYSEVERALTKKSTGEWMTILGEADIPVMPLHTLADLLEDKHLKDVGFFKIEKHPTEGNIVTTQLTSQWSKSTPLNDRHAPSIGEQGVEILLEAGFSSSAIKNLVSSEVLLDLSAND